LSARQLFGLIPQEEIVPENDRSISLHPSELLQNLLRFDTTNPPGNERGCIEYINNLLKQAGFETTLIARSPERPNLIARLKGAGKAPPLLLYGHVDVVNTVGQRWTHPPFEGRIVDGYLWGRGAMDMKSGVAMMLAAFLKARADSTVLPGDVIFCAVADEEAGGDFGSRFLVKEHPDLFQDVKYAFGESGGFNLSLAGKRIFPIMVSEKQRCWMKVTFRGSGGHGSMPVHHQAVARLARMLSLLDQKQLPYHLTPAVRVMVNSIAEAVGGVSALAIRALTNPVLAGPVLTALGERARIFTPLLHNTISPTMLKASEKINVIPTEVTAGLDGRLLPGFTPVEMEEEMHTLLGKEYDLEILGYDPGPSSPDLALFSMLSGVIQELDPQGKPVPYVMGGVSDARFFSTLGIQTYGFNPLLLPDDFKFIETIHGVDERVPVAALDFGVQAIYNALQRFGAP
jgi:acetylornithine deacetylase/succinyl-diaminopimelate desuccinylase-like protein